MASNVMKCQMRSGSQIDTSALRELEQRLLSWTPEPPSDFTSTFSNQEILGMKAQALMYQMAGLLTAHRFLNPIGTLDDVANSYANSIMHIFSRYSALVGPGTRLHNIAFPILMAALEISSVPKEIWKGMTLLTLAPTCVAKMLTFVEYVWAERRCGSTRLIFDLIDSGPDFVVVP